MLLGAHFSIRRSLCDGLAQAQALGCEALQIFGYRRHEFYFDAGLDAAKREAIAQEIKEFRKALPASGVRFVAVHSRSLALLAVENGRRRQQIMKRFREELVLAQMLKADAYIFHPGPYLPYMDVQEGLALAAKNLAEVAGAALPDGLKILMENVPGGGRRLGATPEEWHKLLEPSLRLGLPVGLCFDFSHCWGAGYDIATRKGIAGFFDRFHSLFGRNLISVFHFNNSRRERGCHLDDHAHLDEGRIAGEAYGWVLSQFHQAVGILETPKDPKGSDAKNLAFLRRLW